MIYLVSNREELFSSELYSMITIEESLKLLNKEPIIGLDTETSGLDPHTKDILCIQLGTYDFQVVVDTTTIDIQKYKSLLEDKNKLFILWNAKFDLKFLYKHNIILQNLWDGFLAEKVLYMGYPLGFKENSLKWAGEYYLNISLDKSVRGEILRKGLTPTVIEYSANDVKYLERIMSKQRDLLKEKDLLKAIKLENRFVLPLAYMEYCGVKIDVNKWTEKAIKDEENLQASIYALNSFLSLHPLFSHLTYSSLFEDVESTINWSSTKQVVPIFKKLGVDTIVIDKKTKKEKDSLKANVLSPQKEKTPLIELYLNYKKWEKLCSTYGLGVLQQINPRTGRIHANFHQLNTGTGRLSSGGQDVLTGQESMNLQNLPADHITRSCFIAEEGNKWLSADYSGQESCLMASIAEDNALIHELSREGGDVHSLVAKEVFKEEIGDTDISEIKSKFKKLRQLAKGYELKLKTPYIEIYM